MPDHDDIIKMQTDIDYLKVGQTDLKREVDGIRDKVATIDTSTAEIKAILSNGSKFHIGSKLYWFVIIGLVAILATVLGVKIPL